MSKVYITQATLHNLASAKSFGELVVLLNETRDQTFAPQVVLTELREKLANFTDDDFLVLVGDPVAMALAVNAAAQANGGCVKLLKWSKRFERYYPIEVDFN
jgi:hypothetical protein